jgi:hypothetical protein
MPIPYAAGALAAVGDEGRHDRRRADDRRQILFS